MTLEELIAQGFECSESGGDGQISVRCNSCEALVINGTPCHERGCPEAKHECAGCNELIPTNQKYCGDCR